MAAIPYRPASPDFLGSPFAGVAELAADDRAAFTSFYVRQAPRVHRFLRDLLGDATLAADATQETFARVFARGDLLRDGAHAAHAVPWVFGIARNVSLEMKKARARAGRVFQAGTAVTDPAAHAAHDHCASAARPTPESHLLEREALRAVDRALAKLTEERRALLLLRLDHGFSYDEIAELMGFSLAKVKVEIFRAREILRETLAEYRDDNDGGVK